MTTVDGTPAATSAAEPRARDSPGEHAARNTAVLVAVTALTNLADGITRVALPLLAVGVTGSPALVAGVGLSLTLPWLLASLHVGVLVDRLDRRLLLGAANLARLSAVAALLTAVATDTVSLPLLYAAALVVGTTDVVAGTALSALVPSAVPVAARPRANAWMTGAETVANEFAGPAVGGLLIGLGTAMALGATAAGYVLGVLILALLVGGFRAARTAPAGQGAPARATVRADIAEGLRFLWGHRLLRVLTFTISALIVCWSAWLALLPTYATTDLRLDATGYGLLLSAIGAGGLAGVLLGSGITRLLGQRLTLFADLVGTFLMVAVPAVSGDPWLVGAAAFAGGMGGTLWTVTARTIAQSVVPDHMYGRYSATARLLGWGTLPLGAALAGGLAEAVGARWTFAVFAAVVVATMAPFLRTVTTERLARVSA